MAYEGRRMKRSRTFLTVPLLTAALLASCAGTPPSHQVTVLQPQSLGLAAAPAPTISDAWWKAFNDPQLDRLVDQALAGSPSLAMALARLRAADTQIALARAATLPQANFDAQEQYLLLSGNYTIPPPYGGSWQWVGTVAANLSWSIDLFGKQETQLAKMKATAAAATLDAAAARLALAGAVTQSYISLARANDLADVAGETVNQRQGILTLTVSRVANGLENTAAQHIAEAQAAAAEVEHARVNALKDIAVHEIAMLTGHGADAYTIARPKLNVGALALPESLPTDLLARRADIAAAKLRITAATAGEELARKAFYPDVNLLGTFGVAALGLGSLVTADSLQYGAGPAVHLPLFEGGQLRARYEGAASDVDAAVAAYNQSVLGAVRQAADAISSLRTLDNQSTHMRNMRTAAEAGAVLAQRRYQNGLAPQLNVFNSQDLVIQARHQATTLATDIASARVALVMALGGGFVPLSSSPQE